MMGFFQPGLIPIKYEAFDSGASALYIKAYIYDITGAPVLFDTVTLAQIGSNGMYAGSFTGIAGKIYVIEKLVYTDGTYTTLDPDRSSDADEVQCASLEESVQSAPQGGQVMTIENHESVLINEVLESILIIEKTEVVL